MDLRRGQRQKDLLALKKAQKEENENWCVNTCGIGANGALCLWLPSLSPHQPTSSSLSPPSQNPKKNIFRTVRHLASLLLKSLCCSEKALASKCCQNWIIFYGPSFQYCELIGASNPDHRDRETSTTPGNVHHRDHRHGDGDGDNDDGCYDCQSNIKACKQDKPQT